MNKVLLGWSHFLANLALDSSSLIIGCAILECKLLLLLLKRPLHF